MSRDLARVFSIANLRGLSPSVPLGCAVLPVFGHLEAPSRALSLSLSLPLSLSLSLSLFLSLALSISLSLSLCLSVSLSLSLSFSLSISLSLSPRFHRPGFLPETRTALE